MSCFVQESQRKSLVGVIVSANLLSRTPVNAVLPRAVEAANSSLSYTNAAEVLRLRKHACLSKLHNGGTFLRNCRLAT